MRLFESWKRSHCGGRSSVSLQRWWSHSKWSLLLVYRGISSVFSFLFSDDLRCCHISLQLLKWRECHNFHWFSFSFFIFLATLLFSHYQHFMAHRYSGLRQHVSRHNVWETWHQELQGWSADCPSPIIPLSLYLCLLPPDSAYFIYSPCFYTYQCRTRRSWRRRKKRSI